VIDPQADRPVYRQVADHLRRHIVTGDWPPGTELQAEADLAREYGVGVDAIRDALALLVAEGLVEKRRGHRSRVRHTPEVSVVPVPGDHEIGARPATEAERRELNIPEGGWVLFAVDRAGVQVFLEPADRTRFRWRDSGRGED
jgi:DNA-binding FadR family transcriptional regulator